MINMITEVLFTFSNKQSEVHVDHVDLKQCNFVHKQHCLVIYIIYYTNASTNDQDKA